MGGMWRECHQDDFLLTTEIYDLKCLMGRMSIQKGTLSLPIALSIVSQFEVGQMGSRLAATTTTWDPGRWWLLKGSGVGAGLHRWAT